MSYDTTKNIHLLTNTAYLNLAADRFFAREIFFPQPVEFTTKLGIDAVNLKNKNVNNHHLINWINSFDKEFTNKFLYKNHYHVSNKKHLKLWKSWDIYNNITNYQYHELDFKFNDLSQMVNKTIKNLWTISDRDKNNIIKIEPLRNTIESSLTTLELKKTDIILEYPEHNSSHVIKASFGASVDWTNKQQPLFTSGNTKQLFIPYKTTGQIINDFLLLVNERTYKVSACNDFEFTKKFLFSPQDQLNITITPTNNNHFTNLKNFKSWIL